MRRRQGFTITELLVSMALIVFIMVILTEAFSAGLQTFRELKAIGDMQERLRSATIALRRDLQKNHFTDQAPRLSDQLCNKVPGNGAAPAPYWEPPSEGYFRIWQRWVGPFDPLRCDHNSINEGTEAVSGGGLLPVSRATNHVLQFSCYPQANTSRTAGLGREEFRTVQVPPGALEAQGPYAYRQGGRMTTNAYEVTYFLKPQYEADGVTPMRAYGTDLFALHRREHAISRAAGNNPVPNTPPYVDVSAYLSGGIRDANRMDTINDPRNRFGTDGATQSGMPVGFPNWTLADTLGATDPRAGDDIVVTDVISFDIKVLPQGWNPTTGGTGTFVWDYVHPQFVDLPPPSMSRNSDFRAANYSVFDTWCPVGRDAAYQRIPGTTEGWNSGEGTMTDPNQPISMPLRIRVLALQITIRIWDQKTEQTRQVSIVQEM